MTNDFGMDDARFAEAIRGIGGRKAMLESDDPAVLAILRAEAEDGYRLLLSSGLAKMCSEPLCASLAEARGKCARHYLRAYRAERRARRRNQLAAITPPRQGEDLR